MISQTGDQTPLFEHAPPLLIQEKLGLARKGSTRVWHRAAAVALIGWLPLVLLTLVQGLVWNPDVIRSFLYETGVHARYLVAAPLLVVAESECGLRLSAIARHFIDSRLVQSKDRHRFDQIIESTKTLLRSPAAETVVIVLSYAIVAAAVATHAQADIPLWHRSFGGWGTYSPAGWWHMLVSMPLLVALILGWLWRVILWTRLLWIVSQLDLRLVPSHPDKAAGLGFVGHSVGAFAIVALALSAIAAGRSAHLVLIGGGVPPPQNIYFNAGFLAVIVLIFTAPLLAFSRKLLAVWHEGTFEYGALAIQIGVAFEDKWLNGEKAVSQSALAQPDFSATTDLYSVAANVDGIRLLPVDLKDVIALVVAALIPFIPVVLLAVPAGSILKALQKLLL
jgi:hypothetical protein